MFNELFTSLEAQTFLIDNFLSVSEVDHNAFYFHLPLLALLIHMVIIIPLYDCCLDLLP